MHVVFVANDGDLTGVAGVLFRQLYAHVVILAYLINRGSTTTNNVWMILGVHLKHLSIAAQLLHNTLVTDMFTIHDRLGLC